jgi:hypothetical protein
MMRREETKAVRVVMKINVGKKRGRERLKRWLDKIKRNMKAVDVCVEDAENRDEWRFKIRDYK